jgi:hypothetical protein
MNRKQELQDLQDRWQTVNQQMLVMQRERDIATQSERKFELEQKIKEKETRLENILQQMQRLQDEEKLEKLRTNLFQQKRNGHFGEAIKTAEAIFSANPTEPRIAEEISQLKEKQAFYQQALQVLGELGTRISELEMVFYLELVEKLHPKNQNDDLITLLTPITRQFLAGEIDADRYQQICQAQIAEAGNKSVINVHVDHAELRKKIINGDTVLFLGTELINFYDQAHQNETELAQQLAEEIDYKTFHGNLSAIAELIQSRQGGKKDLLNSLHQSLPQQDQRYRFYQSLAENAKQHLILVSSAYDRLLEQAFLNAGKPFVEIASIINRTQNYDIGHVVLNYSDDDKDEIVKPQEELSTLNLLETHTIIYKIRGTCMDANNKQLTARKDALTLSEDNYLTFAENARKMIPNVLAEHLREREILFVGFSPKSWEERLLVRTLLKHRYNSDYLCLRMQDGDNPDLIETAFWEKQNIKSTDIDFYALDDHLQGAAS